MALKINVFLYKKMHYTTNPNVGSIVAKIGCTEITFCYNKAQINAFFYTRTSSSTVNQ
jgi:hypothetical protein